MRTAAERFSTKVAKNAETGCHHWTASLDTGGYGQFWSGDRKVSAHRWAYEQAKGLVPAGLDLDHLCRNRACVNPEHLEPVTRKENLARGIHHYAVRSTCKHGHELTEDNIYHWRGSRLCRACRRSRRS